MGFLVDQRLEAFGDDVIQRDPLRHQLIGVEIALCHQGHDRRIDIAVGDRALQLALLENDGIGLERRRLLPDRDDQNLPFVAGGVDALRQHLRNARDLEGHMHAAGRRADRRDRIRGHRVDHRRRAKVARLLAAHLGGLHHMDLGRARHAQRLDHQKPDRPGAEDRGLVPGPDLRQAHRMQRDGGGLDQRALLHRQPLGHLVDHARGHHAVRRKAAVTAGQADEAEALAEVILAFETGGAGAAGKDRLDRDAVADREPRHARAQFRDRAAIFVPHGDRRLVLAQGVVLLHRHEDRPGEVFMQVAAADAGPGDLDLHLARLRAGFGDILDADVFDAVPTCCFHGLIPLFVRFRRAAAPPSARPAGHGARPAGDETACPAERQGVPAAVSGKVCAHPFREEPGARGASGQVMHLLQAVDGRLEPLHPGLQLQREVERVMPRLVQVAAVEPQVLLLGRLPHVALFALPGTGILGGVGAEAPDLTHLVRHLLADEVGGPAVHRAVAGGHDHEIRIEMGAVGQHHAGFVEARGLALHQLDRAVDDELAGAHVDVIARPAAQVFHEQARAVIAPVEIEARLLEPGVELRIALAHLVVKRDLELVHDLVGQRGKDHVGLFRGHPGGHGLFGIKRAKPDLHQAVRANDMGRGALHHGDVGIRLPKRGADVMRRVVGTDHHHLLPGPVVGALVLRAVLDLAAEALHPREGGHVRLARHAGGKHQLRGAERHLLAVAVHLDLPGAACRVKARLLHLGARPVIQLHHLGVHLEPVADLVLGGEDRPVVGELDVGQMVVPDRVMQAERLVARAPLVAGPVMLVEHDGRHAKLAQPRGKGDAALPAADDDGVGLPGIAKLGRLRRALFRPGHAVLGGTVFGPHRAPFAPVLLEALQLLQRGQQGPDPPLLQAHQAPATAGGGFEGDPGSGDAALLGGDLAALQGEPAGPRVLELRGEHVLHPGRPLHRLQVPGHGDQIAPVAVGGKERAGCPCVAFLKGGVQAVERLLHLCGDCRVEHCVSSSSAM
ncbi:hypothetical protein SDC9_25585 [bioreactor metagenome]|uniref:Uncharacterized protein n=1 Tax=bioreactor metagenome TaxID=1076179 RepID=A0A644ULC9_9ZZZZ